MSNFTERAIKETLIKLLNDRPLSQITVKDIVEECGINRNSFYYHFQDLPSLVEEIITEEAENIIKEYPSVDSIEDCLKAGVQFAVKNRKAVLHIYNSSNRDLYEQHMWRVCQHVVSRYIDTAVGGRQLRDNDKKILIRYYKCMCFGQVMEWLDGGMKEDIMSSFSRICELKKGMLEEIINRSIESK